MWQTDQYIDENGRFVATNEYFKIGLVCATSWNDITAKVACKTLGYTDFKNWGKVLAEEQEIAFDLMVCNNVHIQTLSDCNIIENMGYCFDNHVVTLECQWTIKVQVTTENFVQSENEGHLKGCVTFSLCLEILPK